MEFGMPGIEGVRGRGRQRTRWIHELTSSEQVEEEAWQTSMNLRRTKLLGKDLCMMSPGVARDLMDDDDDDLNVYI